MAADFPGAFDGYALSVVESHQSRKADTSGTAKAIATSLAALTNEPDFTADDFRRIERVRDRAAQLAGGGVAHAGVSPVPEAALDGHAYHTYSMTSADGEVEFQVRHNVNGRSTYAEVCAGLLSLSLSGMKLRSPPAARRTPRARSTRRCSSRLRSAPRRSSACTTWSTC